jgi:hypothetical protein
VRAPAGPLNHFFFFTANFFGAELFPDFYVGELFSDYAGMS